MLRHKIRENEGLGPATGKYRATRSDRRQKLRRQTIAGVTQTIGYAGVLCFGAYYARSDLSEPSPGSWSVAGMPLGERSVDLGSGHGYLLECLRFSVSRLCT